VQSCLSIRVLQRLLRAECSSTPSQPIAQPQSQIRGRSGGQSKCQIQDNSWDKPPFIMFTTLQSVRIKRKSNGCERLVTGRPGVKSDSLKWETPKRSATTLIVPPKRRYLRRAGADHWNKVWSCVPTALLQYTSQIRKITKKESF